MRALTPAEERLAGWLQRLVALLLAMGGSVARQLTDTVAGHGALLALDDARLWLWAEREGGTLVVTVEPGDSTAAALHTRAQVLRDVIDGRALLDAVVADGRLHVRAPLPELLAFHALVMRALAEGPRQPALQALWAEFDREWPRADAAPVCPGLAAQAPCYGVLCQAVPPSVQQARSPLFEPDPLS